VAAEGGAGKLDGLKDLVTTAGGSLQTALPKKLADPQRSLVGRRHPHTNSVAHRVQVAANQVVVLTPSSGIRVGRPSVWSRTTIWQSREAQRHVAYLMRRCSSMKGH